MINDDFKLQLAAKLADGIIHSLTLACDKKRSNEHLQRLSRLVDDGQIAKSKMVDGLEVVARNVNLPEEVRNEAIERLNYMVQEMPSSSNGEVKFEGLVSKVEMDKALSQSNYQYCSDNIIAPISDVEGESNSGWLQVSDEKLSEFFVLIGPVDGLIRVNPKTTLCHWCPLPWYDNVALIRITDPNWSDAKLALYYLFLEGKLLRLNGTSPPIHHINAMAKITLTEQNVTDYLKFFGFFVRGEEGPFYIIENIEDKFLSQLDTSNDFDPYFAKIMPIKSNGFDENGHFLLRATVFYSNALFDADFSVHATGMVEMTDDHPIAAELPIKIEAPLGR